MPQFKQPLAVLASRRGRYGLISIGTILLVFAVELILTLPGPP
jgi:hypothetical protein